MIHHDSPIESSQKMGRYASISQVYPKSIPSLVIIWSLSHYIPMISPRYIPSTPGVAADEVEEALLPDNGGMKRAAL